MKVANMVKTCIVEGCKSTWAKENDIKFYRIPSQTKEPERRSAWLKALRIPEVCARDYHRVCSQHFVSAGKVDDGNHPDFIPSVNLPKTHKPTTLTTRPYSLDNGQARLQRYDRVKRRATPTAPPASDLVETGVACQTDTIVRILAEKTTQTSQDVNNLLEANKSLKSENDHLRGENMQLRQQYQHLQQENLNLQKKLEEEVKKGTVQEKVFLEEKERLKNIISKKDDDMLDQKKKYKFGVSFLENDDARVKFYTGLPTWQVFKSIVDYLCQKSNQHPEVCENEIFIVFLKLRLNLLHRDIGYRLNMSMTQVSTKFHDWLDAMYKHLGGLVMWPRDDQDMQLPAVFQNRFLKNVRVVLDCFEIFIERPIALKARAQTYSSYKSHNTVKLLLGISPSCSISFVSRCWGGRTSDRAITLKSGLLDKVDCGQSILADRGFLISEDCAVRGIKLIIPAFTKGKKQLSRKEVEMSRFYSRARIHVERVINRIRDYRILKGPIPISLLKLKSDHSVATLDKIVRVACALTNVSQPVLK